ncbi:hypothetical protein ACFWOJ_36075 [Streptomyces sp. NPDC058439]|uniref:hypothetical protein n=1 Tax=Streptomyces sp. NPDC058439 TaxID=3346500 RepID=UPI00365319FA
MAMLARPLGVNAWEAIDAAVVDDIRTDARLIRVVATAEEIAASDAVVLLTEHTEFDYDDP